MFINLAMLITCVNRILIFGTLAVLAYFFGIPALVFGALIMLAGYYDWKSTMIPDILSAAMWCALFLSGINFPIAVGSFAGLYMINSFFAVKRGKPAAGWGDILILPVFFAFILDYGYLGIVAAACGLIGFDLVCVARKSGQPLIPWLMCAYVAAAISTFIINFL